MALKEKSHVHCRTMPPVKRTEKGNDVRPR